MSEAKTKGSDGIERTIDEWREFVHERRRMDYGEQGLDLLLQELHTRTQDSFMITELLETSEDFDVSSEVRLKELAQAAGEYYAKAFIDAVNTKKTMQGRYAALKAHLEKIPVFSRGFKAKYGKRLFLGLAITDYMHEFDDIPRSRKVLKKYIEEREYLLGPAIPQRTIAEYLRWYKLEDLCRDNTSG
jgi:hypothetical protein